MDNEKTVGMILKEARQSKGLSLADVEKGTSIRSRYLEAVENDEYDKTPGEVFLKGIIRNYGNFLDLDGPALVDAYKASAAGMAAEAVRSQGIREVEKVRLNIQLKDKRDIGSGTGRFEMPKLPLKQCLAGLAVAGVLAAGYFAIPAAIDYAKNMPKDDTKEAQQVNTNAATPVASAALDKVTVEMEAEGACWLEVTADGKEIFAGTLQPKDKKTFEAKDKLIIKYGNIGVIRMKVNGEAVDLKGEHGVAVKTYTRANSAAEASAPTPAAAEEKTGPSVSESTPASAVAPAPQADEPKAAEPKVEQPVAETKTEAAPAQEQQEKAKAAPVAKAEKN